VVEGQRGQEKTDDWIDDAKPENVWLPPEILPAFDKGIVQVGEADFADGEQSRAVGKIYSLLIEAPRQGGLFVCRPEPLLLPLRFLCLRGDNGNAGITVFALLNGD
jgi:hypothetical protein